jgi:hypothetical protein
MDATNRLRAFAQLMRDWPPALGSFPALTKPELRAALDACDDWIEANAASFNSALPQPARGALTAPQKTYLFCYVAMRRAGLLRAEED